MGARRVPRRARRPAARRQRARRSLWTTAGVRVRARRLRRGIRVRRGLADGGRGDRGAGADGRCRSLRAPTGPLAGRRAVPARAAAQGGRGVGRGRRAGARPRTGRRGRDRRRVELALGLPRQRPVRAGGRSARTALAAQIPPARGTAARHPRGGAVDPRTGWHRVRAHRRRRRGMDHHGRARGHRVRHRGRVRLLRHGAPPAPSAVRRACARAPARRGGRARRPRRIHRDARDDVPGSPARAVRSGRLGVRLGSTGRAVRPWADRSRAAERMARRQVRVASDTARGAARRDGGSRTTAPSLPRQLARARAGGHGDRRRRLRRGLPARDGTDHERRRDGQGRRRSGGKPAREAGRRRIGCSGRGLRVRRCIRRRGDRRWSRARRGAGVDRGRDQGCQPPPGRGPRQPHQRRRQQLRRGRPLGPRRLHGGLALATVAAAIGMAGRPAAN